jgi:hypothetical protein
VPPICIVGLTNVFSTAIPAETVSDAETDCELVMPLVDVTACTGMLLSGVPTVFDVTVKPTVHVCGTAPTVSSEMLLNVIVVPAMAAEGAG